MRCLSWWPSTTNWHVGLCSAGCSPGASASITVALAAGSCRGQGSDMSGGSGWRGAGCFFFFMLCVRVCGVCVLGVCVCVLVCCALRFCVFEVVLSWARACGPRCALADQIRAFPLWTAADRSACGRGARRRDATRRERREQRTGSRRTCEGGYGEAGGARSARQSHRPSAVTIVLRPSVVTRRGAVTVRAEAQRESAVQRGSASTAQHREDPALTHSELHAHCDPTAHPGQRSKTAAGMASLDSNAQRNDGGDR